MKSNDIDTVIMLLEALEIKSKNPIIAELKEDIGRKLKKILSQANNPDWLLLLLLEAREKARRGNV